MPRRIGIAISFVCCLGAAGAAWSAKPHSTPGVDSGYYKVRVATARALTGHTDSGSRQDLVTLASDRHPLVRLTAIHALSYDASPEAARALARAGRDTTPLVRAYVRR